MVVTKFSAAAQIGPGKSEINFVLVEICQPWVLNRAK